MDYYWSFVSYKELPIVKDEVKKKKEIKNAIEDNLEYRELQQKSHNSEHDYHFMAYLAYILYSPLYIAGPIINFNAFYHQVIIITTKIFNF